MSEVNLNVSSQQPLQGPEDAQATQQQQIGQSQRDTLQPNQPLPDTSAPEQSNTPILPIPNPVAQQTQQQQQDPAAIEQRVREALETDPEIAEFVSEFLNRRGRNTEQGKRELSENILRFLQQRGGDGGNTATAVREALANQLQSIIGNSPTDVAGQLQPLLNQLRGDLIKENNPSLEFLVDALALQNEGAGQPPAEARANALAQALNQVDGYFVDNDATPSLSASNSLYAFAITESLASIFPADVGIDGQNLEAGVFVALGQLGQVLNTGATQVSNVNATPEVRAANLQTRVQQAQNLATTTQQIIDGTIQLAGNLGLSASEQQSLTEYLALLAEAIAAIQVILNELQISDARQAQDLSRVEADLSERRAEARIRQAQKQLEQIKKAREARKKQKLIKGLTYAAAAVLLVVGVLATPVSGPGALLAVIAIAVVLFAATTALTETGTLSKGFQALTNAILEAVENSGGPEWAQQLSVVLAYTAIVATIVVLAVATRGAAGNALGGALRIALTGAAVQATTTIVASSNVVSNLVQAFAAADPDANEEIVEILTIVLTALVLITISLAGGAAIQSALKGSTGQASKAVQTLQKAAPFVQAAVGATQSIPQVLQGLNLLEIADLEEEQAEIEALITTLTEIIRSLRGVIEGLQNDAQATVEQAADLTELFDQTVAGLSTAIGNVANANA